MRTRALARMAGGLLAGTLAVVPLTAPAPAHAGQVGITLGITGAGYVEVVEGSLEDGAPIACDKTANRDHRVTLECPRIRNEEPFEAWVWLRPLTAYIPSTWEFAGWTGCDQTRVRNERTECGVGSPAFGSVEKYPVAIFRDAVAPTVTNLQASQQALTQGGFRFTWNHSGAIRNECRVDSQPWQTCTTPREVVVPAGRRSFEVRAEDQSGNLSTVQRVEFSSIETDLYGMPRTLVNTRSAQFWFDSVGGDAYDCSLDGVSVACTNAGNVRFDNLGEGSHVFTVAGRYGAWYDPLPERWDWSIDLTAPDTTIDRGPAEGARVATRDADFFLTTPGSAVSIACTLDGAPITCRHGDLALRDLGPGTHVLTAAGTDAAGNTDPAPARRTWTVDTSAPVTSVTGGPAAGGLLLTPSTAFLLGSTEPGTMACTLDGRARSCAPGRHPVAGLAPGTHTLTAAATDLTGNRDTTPVTRWWTVPAPARALVRSAGWSLLPVASAYGGQVASTTRKNASLSVAVRGARSLALVASGGTTHGTVRVYAGSRLLKTVSLRTTRSVLKRVVPIAAFGSAWSGTVRIVVATSGRPVRIEGLAAPTR